MSEKPDIIFIKPGSQKKLYGSLSKSLSALEPPIWAALQAAYLREKGYSVEIIDVEVEGKPLDEIANELEF